MRLVVIHLSDLHFKKPYQIDSEKISAMSRSLHDLRESDQVIICCTGDVAFSGAESQYKNAGYFLGQFISQLRKTYRISSFIKVFIVPGNHDLLYNESRTRTREILQQSLAMDEENFLSQETELLNSFWKFAQYNKCFMMPNKFVFSSCFWAAEKKIRIVLINSASMSLKSGDDQGIHFISKANASIVCTSQNADITIALMHHTIDWFSPDSKQLLLAALRKSCSVLLLGHEHLPNGQYVTTNLDSDMLVLNGGMLSNLEEEASSFNVLYIDLEDFETQGKQFNYVSNERIYIPNTILQKKLPNKKNGPDFITPNPQFIADLKSEERYHFTNCFCDYFTFPRVQLVEEENFSSKKDLLCMEELLDEINQSSYVIFDGSENCGKTILAKSLFLEYIRMGFTPLFFDSISMKNKEMNKIIKRAFEDQYSDSPNLFVKYQQLRFENKIAIVDNVQQFEEKQFERIITTFQKSFSIVILFSRSSWNFDILGQVEKKAELGKKFKKCKLPGFFSDRRKELIRRVATCLSAGGEAVNEDYVEQINKFIHNQLHLFNLDPDFIIQLTQQYYNNATAFEQRGKDVFSSVFEANIVNALKLSCGKSKVEETLLVLEDIAYFIHFNRKYPLAHSDFEEIVRKYNTDYGMNVNSKALYDNVCSAKILKISSDSWDIRFTNNNYLAFFVARKLNRIYNDTGDMEPLNYIVSNICFGINGDILLFLSYITNNIRILMLVQEECEKLVGPWSEIDFDNNNIAFLSSINEPEKLSLPTPKDREDFSKSEVVQEQIAKESERIQINDIYDYDESEIGKLSNQIICALKLTQLIAKAFPSFYPRLKIDQKKVFANSIYNYPNKILYQILNPLSKDFDTQVNQLVDEINEQSPENKIDKDWVVKSIQKISINCILAVYDAIGGLSISSTTAPLLISESLEDYNSNHALQRLMMLENGNMQDQFVKESEILYDTTKCPLMRCMIPQVARKFWLSHTTMSLANEQRLLGKFFKGNRPNLLLQKHIRKNKY